MAFTLRDQPEPDGAPARLPDGRDGANGPPRLDPAHNGPLPQAKLIELIGRLVNDVSDLADTQLELAKQEVTEAKDEALGSVKRLAVGAGIVIAAALLLVISAWTAFIWFFNWLFGHIVFPTPIGTHSLSWVGWLLGIALPIAAAYFSYKRFIRRGLRDAEAIWPPLPRTRGTLKEDLEWVRRLRTLSGR